MKDCSPGEHPHADKRNFTVDAYLQMCRDGEAKYSLSEVARLMGVTRMHLHRAMIMASVSDEEFDAVLADFRAKGKALSTTAVTDEIKRRQGTARTYRVKCPSCGHVLRERER